MLKNLITSQRQNPNIIVKLKFYNNIWIIVKLKFLYAIHIPFLVEGLLPKVGLAALIGGSDNGK